ncbi:hypothetical protein N7466_005694 [Penicillium verhagenii]|uniref:uncharacterized protein n=1 Tax=Penicillium verhagenii TaxID=1562060 RepID=UPI002544E673|nr:uncharacterized protein N7466_005694 [Penicillium verhagenii]KAJ5930201.1 hypothetical protein N7466_005694 [Penicillium verhagenii]
MPRVSGVCLIFSQLWKASWREWGLSASAKPLQRYYNWCAQYKVKAALEFDLMRSMATLKGITVDKVLMMLGPPARVAGLGVQGTLPSSTKREG